MTTTTVRIRMCGCQKSSAHPTPLSVRAELIASQLMTTIAITSEQLITTIATQSRASQRAASSEQRSEDRGAFAGTYALAALLSAVCRVVAR